MAVNNTNGCYNLQSNPVLVDKTTVQLNNSNLKLDTINIQ